MMLLAGVVVPYGQTGVSGTRRVRFAPGSVRLPVGTVVLRDHDQAQRIGRVTAVTDGPDGLAVTIRLRSGRRAARVWAEVADGSLTGLSVGADWVGRLGLDPEWPATYLVRAAVGREVSVVPVPAFAGARVRVRRDG